MDHANHREPPPNPGTTLREVKAMGRRWGLDEFVAVVNGLVERYLPAKRGFNVKLRAAFNPRLVRYYATFGLIAPPEREGKEARYHYGHLLQALVIRRLLFEGYTAPALLKMLAGKTEADYEAVLAGGVSTAAGTAMPRDEPIRPIGTARAETLFWRRVEIAPGLELHVRADFVAPDTDAGRESLLRVALENLSGGG